MILYWEKRSPKAMAPSKAHPSDSGFDLTLVSFVKKEGEVEIYDTGIAIQAIGQYYMELVARSSLQKRGYMLANSVGVIDRGYTGNVFVCLYKFDKEAPQLEVPARVVQIVPRPLPMVYLEKVDQLITTQRGDKGFGSTGQ